MRFPVRTALAAFLALLALIPASASAAPSITSTSFSGVTETGATLDASVDPGGSKVSVRFQFTPLDQFKKEGFAGASEAPGEAILVLAEVKGKGKILTGSESITDVTTTAGAFAAGQTITAPGLPAETKIKAVEEDPGDGTLTLAISKAATATAEPELKATGPQPVSAQVSGLVPATGYVFRATAKKASGAPEEVRTEPPLTFYTYSQAPVFGSCPNEELRSGGPNVLLAPGAPGALLPDCRAFEQASPTDKNGNEAASSISTPTRAAADGSAVTFGATFPVPGGEGAQALPFFQASRGEAGWTTRGLLPPASTGGAASFMVGQLPDLSVTYAEATLYNPGRTALFELHRDSSAPLQLTPYYENSEGKGKGFGFAGASADASSVVIEAPTALSQSEGGPPIPESVPGSRNVYAWDRSSGQLHLASTMNSEAETKELLPKGAYAGPYNWVYGTRRLGIEGGPRDGFYSADTHVVTPEGSVFFTSRSNGHLYERLHPTEPQSEMAGGKCIEPEKACTLDLSAPRRAEPDPAGEAPAIFQLASTDGTQAYFTSSEELTEDANTGPEQAKAAIGRATLHGEEPADEAKEDFLATHALGVAVDPEGEYIYWAEPRLGTIGRAKLEGETVVNPNPSFIEPGEGKCLQEVEGPENKGGGVFVPGVFEELAIPSAPRYVAVDEGHVYWTNSGRRDEEGPIDGGGSIGRATLTADHSGIEPEPEPAFICGEGPPPNNPAKPLALADRLASNPQGIAVDSEHIYWANAARAKGLNLIARAKINGTEAEETFVRPFGEFTPYGVAVDSSHVYFTIDEKASNSYIERVDLEGEDPEELGIGKVGIRGLALDSGYAYWAAQGEGGAIGRIPLAEFNENCPSNPGCEKNFLDVSGTPVGLAVSDNHLFWTSNGESQPNPGADLYRFTRPGSAGCGEAKGCLEDLIPDSSDENGAEVRGVLGASPDGSYLYLAANADLDGPAEAEAGDCKGEEFRQDSGECNIYLLHEGQFSFVARVKTTSGPDTEANNWVPFPWEVFGSSTYDPRSAVVSTDGQTLVYLLRGQLYRYNAGEESTCVSCNPTGGAEGTTSYFGSLGYPNLEPTHHGIGSVQGHFASADGKRVFFESSAALVGDDTDDEGGCPLVGLITLSPSCQDVYEWEAPGTGSCSEGGPAYSPRNGGCLYLISQGSESEPAFLADASASGNDVFFFTRSQLVGQDSDGMRDVYDARVGGGLASQNPKPTPPCEGEGCKPAASGAPAYQAPPQFSGPPNPKPKRCKAKKCHRPKHHKHKKAHHHKKGHGQGKKGGR